MDNSSKANTKTSSSSSSDNDSDYDSDTAMQKKPAATVGGRKSAASKRAGSAKASASITPGAAAIEKPSPFDVVFGRGQPFHSHPGNRRMKQLIADNKERYKQAKKEDKKEVIDFILDAIRNNGPESGRFLKKMGKGLDSPWCEATEKEAYKKVSHSLREKEVFTKPKSARKKGKKAAGAGAATKEKAQLKRADSDRSIRSTTKDFDQLMGEIEPLAIENISAQSPLDFPADFEGDIGDANGAHVFSPPVARAARRHSFSDNIVDPFMGRPLMDRNRSESSARVPGDGPAEMTLDPMSMDSEPEWSSNDAVLLGPLLKNAFEPPPFNTNNPNPKNNHNHNNDNDNHGSPPHNMFHVQDFAPLSQQLLFSTAGDAPPFPVPPLLYLNDNHASAYVSDTENDKSPIRGVGSSSTCSRHHPQEQDDDEQSSGSSSSSATSKSDSSIGNGEIDAEIVALYAENGTDEFSFCDDLQFDDDDDVDQ